MDRPSMGLFAGREAPTICAKVGRRSMVPATCEQVWPGLIRAGQRMTVGTRMPPS